MEARVLMMSTALNVTVPWGTLTHSVAPPSTHATVHLVYMAVVGSASTGEIVRAEERGLVAGSWVAGCLVARSRVAASLVEGCLVAGRLSGDRPSGGRLSGGGRQSGDNNKWSCIVD